ncbi:hypothetical protein BLD48_10350 [Exiguobacterium sp. KRL4]|uniref:hypothetical protein n=1 Tax=Exiguobacterium sp. KRL4 TaxID=1914536 RepID=UPI0008F8998F|nr:hypothetical protein [Exiguobacterium sp. KRL4]OIN66535.1 hypothetical protein BLD48_10350 [Exiguobacterium sp. KRL4]
MFNKKRLEYSSKDKILQLEVDLVLQDLIEALMDLKGHKTPESLVRQSIFALAISEMGQNEVDRINAETLKDYLDHK